MKIDGRQVIAQLGTGRSRSQYDAPQLAGTTANGMGELSRALSSLGDAARPFLTARLAEEQEANDYRDLKKKQVFEGEWRRYTEETKQTLPADGSGYLSILDKEWQNRRKVFLDSISPTNRARYEAETEGLWQDSALQADSFSRDALRGDSLRTLDAETDRLLKVAYQNPDDESAWGALETQIMATPGLTAAEKEERLTLARRQIAGATVGGKIKQTREAAYTVPGSADVRTRIMPALISTESGGDASAVSPKGATGLAQVMPETAMDIAEALGDRNFPFQGTDAERREYLKKPGVSVQYGTFYLNEQLKTFGGDLELALIAYNAGPQRAIDFRDSGRQWAALPPGVQAETRPYVQKIFNKIGAMTPDMVFAPELGLSFEQALGAEGELEKVYAQAQADAAAQVSAMLEAGKRQQEAMYQELLRQTEFGGANFPELYRTAVSEGMLAYDQNAYNRGREVFERVNKAELDRQEAVATLARGDTVSRDQADMLVPNQLVQAAAGGDEEAMGELLNSVKTIGFVPPKVETALTQLTGSEDVRKIAMASAMVSDLRRSNPSFVANLPEPVVSRLASFELLRQTDMPLETIAERMNMTRTPEGQRALSALKDADPKYRENKALLPDQLRTEFNGFLRRNTPGMAEATLPVQGGTMTLLQMQYAEIYDTFFSQTGDAEVAKEAAIQHLGRTWGVTEAGGVRQITYLPPEKFLSNITYRQNGQLKQANLPEDFVRNQFEIEVRSQFGFAEDQRFLALVAPGAEQAKAAGQPVPYTIIPLDEDGQPAYAATNLNTLWQPATFDYNRVIERINGPALAREQELVTSLNEAQKVVDALSEAAPAEEQYRALEAKRKIEAELLKVRKSMR